MTACKKKDNIVGKEENDGEEKARGTDEEGLINRKCIRVKRSEKRGRKVGRGRLEAAAS